MTHVMSLLLDTSVGEDTSVLKDTSVRQAPSVLPDISVRQDKHVTRHQCVIMQHVFFSAVILSINIILLTF